MSEARIQELEAAVQELRVLVQELRDGEAIRDLKARYFRLMDAQDWDAWRQVFTDDAHFELMGHEPVDGADAFVAMVRDYWGVVRTVHHGHTPELTIDSPTEAHGSWVLEDYMEWEPDAETGVRRGLKGYGRYDETYRKVDGEWKIATWSLNYRRIDPLPREPLPEQILGGPELLQETEYVDQVTGRS